LSARSSRRWWAGLLLAACGTGAPAHADGGAALDEAAETARASVRSATEWLARGIDGWFGDKPFSAGGQVRDGLLGLGLVTRQRETPDFTLRFSARVRLPNLEDRAFLFVGRDDPREVVSDQPDALSRRQRLLPDNAADRSFFAGLGFQARESLQFRLGLRGGLKPYAHARHERSWALGEADRIDFRETLFWSLDDRFGSTTVLSYEHAFSPRLGTRWLSSATISQRSRRFEWVSVLSLRRAWDAQRLLSLEALFNGRESSGVGFTDYGLQLRWEQPLHEDWLLGEVLLGHFRPRPDAQAERRPAWAVGGSLKLRF
jgi:hypothetical protein